MLYRLAAFTTTPAGGNPAGVWIGDALPAPAEMLRIAAEVGYSETAFIAPTTGYTRTVRYYSALAEVPFCGHATIASGVKLGELTGNGTYRLASSVGEIVVEVTEGPGGRTASLTTVATRHRPATDPLLSSALGLLGWRRDELDPAIPPVVAFAGAWHLVLAAAHSSRLAELQYDFEGLKALMLAHDLTTLQLVWREAPLRFHARDPFPVGGVVEDPATGAAAAALGGYLRDAGLLETPATFTIRQGEAMGRPSLVHVTVPPTGGVIVFGTAVTL